MIEAGTKNGEMRRAPRFTYSPCVSSISGRPPMPEPTRQPMRSAVASVSASPVGNPASCTAWNDAASPKWMKVSMCRASFAGMYCSTSKPFTSPAMVQAMPEASKRLIVPMPERPASRLAQPSATVLPTGLIRPSPVTTTRRRVMKCFPCEPVRPSGS